MIEIDRTELMSKLAEHATTLGWEIVEWDWKDQIDGADEYHLWVQPLAEVEPEPAPRTPCPDGFHWIGQSLARCDNCGLPAWEHAGIAELPKGAGPFGDEPWVLRPWEPGEAEAIRRKWEPDLRPAEVRTASWVTPEVSR